jgi:hypothetical protein
LGLLKGCSETLPVLKSSPLEALALVCSLFPSFQLLAQLNITLLDELHV